MNPLKHSIPPISELLRQVRQERGGEKCTQKVFAKKVGCTDAYISQIEKGERFPSDDLIAGIVKAYGTDAKDRLALRNALLISTLCSKHAEEADIMMAALTEEQETAGQVSGEILPRGLAILLGEKLPESGLTVETIAEELGWSGHHLRAVLGRQQALTRPELQRLSEKVGLDPDEALLLAGYLPERLTRLVGRQHELRKALAAFSRPSPRDLRMLVELLREIGVHPPAAEEQEMQAAG